MLQLRQYPEREGIAYPKPGTPNPKIGLTVMKLPKGPRIALKPPKKLVNKVAKPHFSPFSGIFVEKFSVDVGLNASGRMAEQDPES